MKVTIKNDSKSSEIKYPCLMKAKMSNEYVLFHQKRVGTILNGENAGYQLTDWVMDLFQPFTGTVELSND